MMTYMVWLVQGEQLVTWARCPICSGKAEPEIGSEVRTDGAVFQFDPIFWLHHKYVRNPMPENKTDLGDPQ